MINVFITGIPASHVIEGVEVADTKVILQHVFKYIIVYIIWFRKSANITRRSFVFQRDVEQYLCVTSTVHTFKQGSRKVKYDEECCWLDWLDRSNAQ